jgi:hypothetical protein
MIAFIDKHRRACGVEPICRVLPIAPSTYHAHASRRGDQAELSIRATHDAVGASVRLSRIVEALSAACASIL